MNLGKKILKTILPKLKSMLQQYAIAQFEIAKAEATSPEQIDALKQQYCPTPKALADLILTRDNIVNQLNSIGNQLGVLDFSIGSIQDVTNSLSQLTTIVDAVKIGVSAASFCLCCSICWGVGAGGGEINVPTSSTIVGTGSGNPRIISLAINLSSGVNVRWPFLIKTPSEFDKTAVVNGPTLSKVITSPFDNLIYGRVIAIIQFLQN